MADATFESSLARTGKLVGGRISVALNALMGSRAEGRFGILYYHRVSDHGSGPPPPLNVTPARFEAQVKGLLRKGFQAASLSDLVGAAASGEEVPPRTVALTFDDGYRGVHRYALPVLAELGVPATVFIASAFIGRQEPFPFDAWGLEHQDQTSPDQWLPLSWEECAELVASGVIEIGTHTHTHQDFRGRVTELERDLTLSRDTIERELGARPELLSLPYGYGAKGFADPSLLEAVTRAGLSCALSTDIELVEPTSSPLRWGRVEAEGSDDATVLAAKLSGWYEWMAGPRQLYHKFLK